jgi:hypothetical protein
MASSRGFLNIQSLKELTYEKPHEPPHEDTIASI